MARARFGNSAGSFVSKTETIARDMTDEDVGSGALLAVSALRNARALLTQCSLQSTTNRSEVEYRIGVHYEIKKKHDGKVHPPPSYQRDCEIWHRRYPTPKVGGLSIFDVGANQCKVSRTCRKVDSSIQQSYWSSAKECTESQNP